jgi:uncharacterized protein YPO0396
MDGQQGNIGNNITNPNTNRNTSMPVSSLSDLSKKYEEKIKTLMQTLGEVNYNSPENLKIIQKKVEDEIVDFEKTIDEECMNRIILTHQINTKLIGKLRELRYDFNQDKPHQSYDNIKNNAVNYLNQLNTNFEK